MSFLPKDILKTLKKINLVIIAFPKFTLYSKNITVNATSILQCCKSHVFSQEYDVHWFKNNQPLIPNKNIVIINNLLILTEIQYGSQGKYKCQIVSKNISGAATGGSNVMQTWNVIKSSKEVNVDIKKGKRYSFGRT